MKTLSRAKILWLHSQLIRQSGGVEGIRDNGLLDSALHAPFQTFDGVELYPTVISKAVRMGYGLIRNHPFVDGNKRIGTHLMLVLLDLNGFSLEYEDQDLIDIILQVACGAVDGQGLLNWVLNHLI